MSGGEAKAEGKDDGCQVPKLFDAIVNEVRNSWKNECSLPQNVRNNVYRLKSFIYS